LPLQAVNVPAAAKARHRRLAINRRAEDGKVIA